MFVSKINEKLFAYALLIDEGYDMWSQYSNTLDTLFLDHPNNEEYLKLESITNIKETAHYLINKMNYEIFDIIIFGSEMMKLIRPIYINSDIHEFGRHMYSIWGKLPGSIQNVEPFEKLCFADDPLSYGDVEKSRQMYEEILKYYQE